MNYLGQIGLKITEMGGVGAGTAFVFGLLLLLGLGWLIRFKMQQGQKIKEGKLALDREKMLSDQTHLRKMESEGAEWRTFLGNHLEHHLQELKDTTVAIKALADSHSRFAAKLIEDMKLTHEKIDNHTRIVNEDHKEFEGKMDKISDDFSFLRGRIDRG